MGTTLSVAVFVFTVLFLPATSAQNVLSNDDVIQMVKANMSEELILGQIQNSKASFDLSTTAVIRLSKEGVSNAVIAAMRNPGQAPSAGAAVGAPQGVKTPDGEKVRLTLMEDLSSATAQQGDRVNFTVAEDVKVGDLVVIAKGASGFGTITAVKKKGMLGQGGKLIMSIDQVKAVDGQNIRLRATSGREGDDKMGKTVAVAMLAGPFALLVKGKDVTSAKGTEYAAYIDEGKEITLKQ